MKLNDVGTTVRESVDFVQLSPTQRSLYKLMMQVAYQGEVDVMQSLLEDVLPHVSDAEAKKILRTWRQ